MTMSRSKFERVVNQCVVGANEEGQYYRGDIFEAVFGSSHGEVSITPILEHNKIGRAHV